MSAPRFPSVPPHKGHYESYYLRAADPSGGRSAWIRHTVFKRPGGPLDARLTLADTSCDLACVLTLAGGVHRTLPAGTRAGF